MEGEGKTKKLLEPGLQCEGAVTSCRMVSSATRETFNKMDYESNESGGYGFGFEGCRLEEHAWGAARPTGH